MLSFFVFLFLAILATVGAYLVAGLFFLRKAKNVDGWSLQQKLILMQLKSLHARGITDPIRSGFEYSKHVGNALAKLKKDGLIEYPNSNTVRLTAKGVAATGSLPLLPILTVHDRQALKAAMGYDTAGDGFKKALSALRARGVVEKPTAETVAINDAMVFPFGLTDTVDGEAKDELPSV